MGEQHESGKDVGAEQHHQGGGDGRAAPALGSQALAAGLGDEQPQDEDDQEGGAGRGGRGGDGGRGHGSSSRSGRSKGDPFRAERSWASRDRAARPPSPTTAAAG